MGVLLEARPALTRPLEGKIYVRDMVFTTGIVDAGDHCPRGIVRAEDLDIAIEVDREQLTGAAVSRVRRRWAGLRSFAPGGDPVIGADPVIEGLYWSAGLGGFGVQTAPAMAELLAREMIDREQLPCR